MTIKENSKKALALVKAQTTKAFTAARDLVINNDEDYQAAGSLKLKVQQVGKIITEQEKKITKPLNEALAEVREMFSPAKQSYKMANELVVKKMIAYDDLKEAAAEEAKKKIASKVETGYIKPETAEVQLSQVQEAPGAVKNNVGTVFIKKVKNVRVINESLIPREYLVIDMVKLRRAILTEGKEVAGAEVFEEKQMGGRAA